MQLIHPIPLRSPYTTSFTLYHFVHLRCKGVKDWRMCTAGATQMVWRCKGVLQRSCPRYCTTGALQTSEVWPLGACETVMLCKKVWTRPALLAIILSVLKKRKVVRQIFFAPKVHMKEGAKKINDKPVHLLSTEMGCGGRGPFYFALSI